MEVEFIYNKTISRQTVSPLKPISYLKKLACQCFALSKDSVQLYYNNKLISSKLENTYIKDYFVKDLIIKIKVKGTSVQLNTFNSISQLTNKDNEREKRIKGLKLNLKELDKKIKLIYDNNTSEIKNFYSERGFFSNYNQQVQIHKKNNINRTISFDLKSDSISNINNSNINLNNFNKNNNISNNFNSNFSNNFNSNFNNNFSSNFNNNFNSNFNNNFNSNISKKIKQINPKNLKEKFHIPLIQKKALSPSTNKDALRLNSILSSKIPIFSTLNPFELNKSNIRYLAHKNLKTRNFANNFPSSTTSNTDEIEFQFEKCQECSEKNILYYCRNDNKFICSKCQIVNHLNHNLIIIEGGNITQAGYKYQKILINEVTDLENETQKLLLKDEEDTTEIITNEIHSIKKNVINLAKTGQLILDIYPDYDILETISDTSIFYKEKVKIYSLITMAKNNNFNSNFNNSNFNNNFNNNNFNSNFNSNFNDNNFNIFDNKNNNDNFSLVGNKLIFNLLQEHEKNVKKLEKNIENLRNKCEYKQMFVSVLEFIKKIIVDLTTDIENIHKKYQNVISSSKKIQTEFYDTIKNFMKIQKRRFNIELKIDYLLTKQSHHESLKNEIPKFKIRISKIANKLENKNKSSELIPQIMNSSDFSIELPKKSLSLGDDEINENLKSISDLSSTFTEDSNENRNSMSPSKNNNLTLSDISDSSRNLKKINKEKEIKSILLRRNAHKKKSKIVNIRRSIQDVPDPNSPNKKRKSTLFEKTKVKLNIFNLLQVKKKKKKKL